MSKMLPGCWTTVRPLMALPSLDMELPGEEESAGRFECLRGYNDIQVAASAMVLSLV
jgi:hypothetical protein